MNGFTYQMSNDVVYEDVKKDILHQEHMEKMCFEKYGIMVYKNAIPALNSCNKFKDGIIISCPYLVSDRCLLYGNKTETWYGAYGISLQKRSERCRKNYPKGENLMQIEMEECKNGKRKSNDR